MLEGISIGLSALAGTLSVYALFQLRYIRHKKADEGAAVAILQTKVAALAQLPLDWEIVLSKLTKLAGRVDKERSLSGPPSLLVDPPQGEQVVAAKPDGAGAFRVSSRKDLLRRGHA